MVDDLSALVNQIALDLWETFRWVAKKYKQKKILVYLIVAIDFYGWRNKRWNNVTLVR